MADPLASVIVPVWNDERRIGLCIEALLGQSLPSEAFEILIVDNGSSDETAKVAGNYPGVRLLEESRPGSYAARNTGLAHARGEFVAFTDSDCIPDPEWLAAGLSAIRDRSAVAIAAGKVVFDRPADVDMFSHACFNYDTRLSMRQEELVKSGHAITANWFSRRQELLDLGGFDASLKSGGDYALSNRISRTGRAVVFVPEAIVRHPARVRVRQITAKARRIVGGKWASERKPRRTLVRTKVETRNFFARTRRIWAASELSWIERAQVTGLLLWVWLLSIAELLRLELGGEPARA